MDEFEHEMHQAFERRPAPPGLKRKLMEKRRARKSHGLFFTWQQLAASLLVTAMLAGGLEWHNIQERHKQEVAREQVMTALRITSHALNQMNARLAARRRGAQD